jgi:uncharacterized protein (DUF983 family)
MNTTVITQVVDQIRAWRDRPRTARVTAIYCPACQQWRHPRRFTQTAATCRTCTTN